MRWLKRLESGFMSAWTFKVNKSKSWILESFSRYFFVGNASDNKLLNCPWQFRIFTPWFGNSLRIDFTVLWVIQWHTALVTVLFDTIIIIIIIYYTHVNLYSVHYSESLECKVSCWPAFRTKYVALLLKEPQIHVQFIPLFVSRQSPFAVPYL